MFQWFKEKKKKNLRPLISLLFPMYTSAVVSTAGCRHPRGCGRHSTAAREESGGFLPLKNKIKNIFKIVFS